MQIRSVRLPLVLLLSLFLASGYVLPAAAQGAVVRVVPPSIEAAHGRFVEIGIAVDGVTNLYAADIRLLFNPDVLQVVDDNEQQSGVQIMLGQVPAPDEIRANIVDNYAGTIHYSVSQQAPRQPFTGSGTLCVVRFFAKALGTSPIEIITTDEGGEAIAVLATSNGERIEITPQQGEIIVTEEGRPPVIPPELPTLDPTVTATVLQATYAPSSTPTVQSPYPMGTPMSALPTNTLPPPPGYPAPTTASLQPSQTASPTVAPAETVALESEFPVESSPGSLPSPTATFASSLQAAYPELVATPPSATSPVGEAAATASATTEGLVAANDDTPTVSPALAATEQPGTTPMTANDSPPAESAPHPSAPQPDPLIPRGIFFALVVGLILFTGALFVRLWRDRKKSGE